MCFLFLEGPLNTPADQSVAPGTDAQIEWVDEKAANVLTYTWSFKADFATTYQTILNWTDGTTTNTNVLSNVAYVSGATISLTSVTAANAGSYRIDVVYNIGNTPSKDTTEVIITVTSKFYILSFIEAGVDPAFYCMLLLNSLW